MVGPSLKATPPKEQYLHRGFGVVYHKDRGIKPSMVLFFQNVMFTPLFFNDFFRT